MKSITKLLCVFIMGLILIAGHSYSLTAQPSGPEILDEGTLEQQFDYLHQRTNIYENFRAIREDMFQKVRRNAVDSINQAYQTEQMLRNNLAEAEVLQDSLSQALEETEAARLEAIRNRDTINLLGVSTNKTFYNVLLWSVIAGLVALLAILLIAFKRTHHITRTKTSELNELQREYEDYRKTSRERFEKQAIDHFNEVKKLKGL